jgi:hypothetical protein
MWAGRLRHNGAAFAALGPARSLAALKGKGPTKGKGKGKAGKPTAAPTATTAASRAATQPALAPPRPKAASSAASSSTPALPEGEPTRADFPQVRGVKRASRELAAQAAATPESRSAALLALHQDMTAASGKTNACSLWSTWRYLHQQWFGSEADVLPLTQEKIFAVAACFKSGGYRAFKGYLSKAKEHHILGGHTWDLQLDFVGRKATMSVTRGLGVARQSTPFKLLQALEAVRESNITLPEGSPLGWSNFLVVATFFILREIEAANIRVGHVTISPKEGKVQLLLPVSKKDPKAVGCTRAWQCLCRPKEAIRQDCPFHAVTRQLGLLRAHFGEDPLPEGLPLFPTAEGQPVARAAVVAALEATVQAYGDPIVQPNGSRLLGGHSFRVTGAQQLASLGVDIIKIMVLARWAGESVLRYVRDAPLDNLPAEVKALEEKKSLLGALEKLQADVLSIDNKVDGQKQEVDRLAAELFKKFGPVADKPFIANGSKKRFKLHWAAVDGVEMLPQLWKTHCGVKFGSWNFTRHVTKDNFPIDTWCTKCFGRSGPAPQVECPTSNSSSENTESDSD